MADMQNVTLLCNYEFEKYLTDYFGDGFEKKPVDTDHFETEVSIDLDLLFLGWLAGVSEGIRALGPAKVIDHMRDIAGRLNEVYGRGKTGREHI